MIPIPRRLQGKPPATSYLDIVASWAGFGMISLSCQTILDSDSVGQVLRGSDDSLASLEGGQMEIVPHFDRHGGHSDAAIVTDGDGNWRAVLTTWQSGPQSIAAIRYIGEGVDAVSIGNGRARRSAANCGGIEGHGCSGDPRFARI